VVTAVRGNNVQVAVDFLPPLLGQIKSGALRALAVSSRSRFAVLPEVPTVSEAGIPGYEVTGWNGVAGPAKMPQAIIDRLNKEIHAVLAAPDLKQRFQELGVETFGGTPAAYRQHVVAEIAKWNGVIDKAKIPRQ